jgi:hypothetical protein
MFAKVLAPKPFRDPAPRLSNLCER